MTKVGLGSFFSFWARMALPFAYYPLTVETETKSGQPYLSNLLEQALDALGAAFVPEAIDDTASSVVEQCLTVAVHLLVRVCATVKRLDIFVVEIDGSSSIFNHFFPVAHRIPTSSTVRVEDGVLFT